MLKITLNDKDLEQLIPRYKAIAEKISNLTYGIKQLVNRLEPALLASDDIDDRLISILKSLQLCEEKASKFISQINITLERFDDSERKITADSNMLIYEFKQILYQIRSNTITASPGLTEMKNKAVIDDIFGITGSSGSVKLGYIAEVANINGDKGKRNENI